MVIAVGDRLPDVTFTVMTEAGAAPKTTDEIFSGKKIVLFAVPGAFTPTCHGNHLPGFVENVAGFKAKGIDEVVCTAVNDIFVLAAWAKASGAEDITFLSDGSGNFARALGLEFDGTARNLGVRSQRYAMLIQDGIVQRMNVEDAPGKAEISSAKALLDAI
jgi:peroxiredoxin